MEIRRSAGWSGVLASKKFLAILADVHRVRLLRSFDVSRERPRGPELPERDERPWQQLAAAPVLPEHGDVVGRLALTILDVEPPAMRREKPHDRFAGGDVHRRFAGV